MHDDNAVQEDPVGPGGEHLVQPQREVGVGVLVVRKVQVLRAGCGVRASSGPRGSGWEEGECAVPEGVMLEWWHESTDLAERLQVAHGNDVSSFARVADVRDGLLVVVFAYSVEPRRSKVHCTHRVSPRY